MIENGHEAVLREREGFHVGRAKLQRDAAFCGPRESESKSTDPDQVDRAATEASARKGGPHVSIVGRDYEHVLDRAQALAPH
jgi:hypothetical protein